MFYKKIRFFFLSTIFFTNLASGFGQNKIQYTNFSWEMLRSPHFYLHYHQNEGNLPKISFSLIENAYKCLNKDFHFTPKNKIPLLIYGDPNYFAQTNVVSEILPEGVGGFTELFKSRIVVPFNGSYPELQHVLHHELVHAFCYSIFSEHFGGNLLANTAIQMPLWFMEGLAEYLSSKWDIEADMFLMDQVINGSVPLPGAELSGYMAYKGGQSFLYYLNASRGDTMFSHFLEEFKQSRSIENCIKNVYGKSVDELGKEWIQDLKRNYWPEISKRELPSTNAHPITNHREKKDNYNLRPRISPDGTKIAFFSDHSEYSSILITDCKGKILQNISQNGYGGFFESFHPFRSGLSWSPDGTKLAFVTSGKGSDEIRIVDVKSKRLQKKICCNLTSISSPDWSRDGTQLVFTGVEKGCSDIYTYNLLTSTIKRLTNDILFESDPKFTVDNKSIVFAIQDTAVDTLARKAPYGKAPSDLIIMDITTSTKRHLTNTRWNEKQPCISADGKKCAFISDRNGIDNIYIGSIDSLENAKPVTDYIGGCSNPDWSLNGDKLVFTLFQQYGWDVWLMNKPESNMKRDSLAPTRWVESSLDSSKSFYSKAPSLPKDSLSGATHGTEKNSNTFSNNTSDQEIGIKEEVAVNDNQQRETTKIIKDSAVSNVSKAIGTKSDSLKALTDTLSRTKDTLSKLEIPQPERYHLKFSPDMISVGLGVNTYYGYAGQCLLSLSDLLGDHRITLAGDIQGNFKDYLHLFGSYFYLKHRLDIGFGAFYSKDYSYANVFDTLLYHTLNAGGFLIAEYPFSLFSRIDFQLLSQYQKRTPVDTNAEIFEATTFLPTLSYTFDNALWGITGPIRGVRASATATVSPPINDKKDHFASLDADVRIYFHLLKKFVWANRLFLGASISLDGGSSARRYLLGGSENWLFYRVNLDEYAKNINNTLYSDFITPFRGWDYIGLSGSRVALLNSEFRFPFIKDITVVWPLPMHIRYISGALFTDIGNAWSEGEMHNGIPLPDKLYGGFGFGLRANLGIFILRYDRAWPTDFRTMPFENHATNYFSLGSEF